MDTPTVAVCLYYLVTVTRAITRALMGGGWGGEGLCPRLISFQIDQFEFEKKLVGQNICRT